MEVRAGGLAGIEGAGQRRYIRRQIAELLGLHPKTVAKGRHELLEQDIEAQRVRRPGGGRKSVEKKRRRSSQRSGS